MAYNPIWKDWDKYKDPQFLFNKFWREPFYPNAPDMDWNDYRSVDYFSSDPAFGRIFETRKTELRNEENDRYWHDKASNMGFDLDNVSYPIRNGIYGSYVGAGDYFEASSSVIDFFDDVLLKWK